VRPVYNVGQVQMSVTEFSNSGAPAARPIGLTRLVGRDECRLTPRRRFAPMWRASQGSTSLQGEGPLRGGGGPRHRRNVRAGEGKSYACPTKGRWSQAQMTRPPGPQPTVFRVEVGTLFSACQLWRRAPSPLYRAPYPIRLRLAVDRLPPRAPEVVAPVPDGATEALLGKQRGFGTAGV